MTCMMPDGAPLDLGVGLLDLAFDGADRACRSPAPCPPLGASLGSLLLVGFLVAIAVWTKLVASSTPGETPS